LLTCKQNEGDSLLGAIGDELEDDGERQGAEIEVGSILSTDSNFLFFFQ